MTTLYAGERLDHPSLTRTLDANGAIRFAIGGALTPTAAEVLGKLIRIDLLAARGANQRAAFVLDCASCPDIWPRALDALRRTTKIVMEEMGNVAFENVDNDLYDLLKVTGFANVFTITRASAEEKPALPTVPL